MISINTFLDILKCIFGYPKNHAEFWISIIRLMDILKSIQGYP